MDGTIHMEARVIFDGKKYLFIFPPEVMFYLASHFSLTCYKLMLWLHLHYHHNSTNEVFLYCGCVHNGSNEELRYCDFLATCKRSI